MREYHLEIAISIDYPWLFLAVDGQRFLCEESGVRGQSSHGAKLRLEWS